MCEDRFLSDYDAEVVAALVVYDDTIARFIFFYDALWLFVCVCLILHVGVTAASFLNGLAFRPVSPHRGVEKLYTALTRRHNTSHLSCISPHRHFIFQTLLPLFLTSIVFETNPSLVLRAPSFFIYPIESPFFSKSLCFEEKWM